MTCYHPLSAFDTGLKTKLNKNKLIIRPEGSLRANFYGKWLYDPILIPCGRCIGCRLDYARTWSKRLMLEKSLYSDELCHFITLTYDDDHYTDLSLNKRDWQLFMKKLRQAYSDSKIRFFMCAEYGSNSGRKHYHAILFNLKIDDLEKIHKLDNNSLLTSKKIEKIWSNGQIAIGPVNLNTCGYVARYILKKQKSSLAEKEIDFVQPPFVLMSRKPGIGANAFDLNWFNNNEIIIDGKTFKPGKYYNKMFEDLGYSTDLFKKQSQESFLRKVTETYFEDLHVDESYKLSETRILKERENYGS